MIISMDLNEVCKLESLEKLAEYLKEDLNNLKLEEQLNNKNIVLFGAALCGRKVLKNLRQKGITSKLFL